LVERPAFIVTASTAPGTGKGSRATRNTFRELLNDSSPKWTLRSIRSLSRTARHEREAGKRLRAQVRVIKVVSS